MKTIRYILFLTLALLPLASPAQQQRSFSDPMSVKFLQGGYAENGKLHLYAHTAYSDLSQDSKLDLLNRFALDFPNHDITVHTADDGKSELWLSDSHGLHYLTTWHTDSLNIEQYRPLEMKRLGGTRMFYYVGGVFNGSDGYNYGALNLRGGTFLYKNLLDASATLCLGYSKAEGADYDFTGSVGIDSRAYLPFRIKNVNLAPYAGAGLSWTFAPEKYTELRLLAGACWFVGKGSLDIGLQYGTESEFSLMVGYTFRFASK